ncbi:MBL fold metallo-hydrolase [Flavivirga jejuensis]|uniref:MBL fold metallo-hydrolase n=1 Tax=Flavivirga jejuensis TaxID=870487 RepID=A0ABT8WVF1_9FLAO|nr:MBL fold metallo-hydrolase [Flavivirga jejuensis]MDO5976975.1 MBL fold metallo-hydrolase [Flavivirga jejuensis]
MNVKVFKVSHSNFKNQCYLAHFNGKGVLIDPAWDFHTIDTFMKDNNIVLLAVLLTHSHHDHTNLAKQFAETYGCPIFMSKVEIDNSSFQCINLIPIDHLKTIDFNEFRVTPILTPGHTEGGICYLIENHLFTGDTFFIEGVGICDEKGANDLFDSVQFIKKYIKLDTKFWPGHSFGKQPGKSLNFLLHNNIYFQFNNRTHFVKFRIRKNAPDPFLFK